MKKYNLKKLLSEAKNRKERRVLILFLAKLGLNKKNASKKVILARHIVQNMTGNAYFATPVPSLASVTTAADVLEAAEAAMDGSAIKTNARNVAEKALVTLLTQLQGYVESVAGLDKTIILSAGMEVRDPRTETGLLGPVEAITIKLGEFQGSVDLKWKAIKRSKLFIVEMRPENSPMNGWEYAGQATKSRVTISNLQSNVTYHFRIMCASSAGNGPVSEVVSIRVY